MTNSAKHTPGPLLEGYSSLHHAIEIYGKDNKTIARLPLPPNKMGESTDPEGRAKQKANAVIFRAASDFLVALQSIAELRNHHDKNDAKEIARAAIAKVPGVAP